MRVSQAAAVPSAVSGTLVGIGSPEELDLSCLVG
jgi:hypothetical protein